MHLITSRLYIGQANQNEISINLCQSCRKDYRHHPHPYAVPPKRSTQGPITAASVPPTLTKLSEPTKPPGELKTEPTAPA